MFEQLLNLLAFAIFLQIYKNSSCLWYVINLQNVYLRWGQLNIMVAHINHPSLFFTAAYA